MNTNTHELESGVFGRAIPLQPMPVVKREVFTLAEHRRLAAEHRLQVWRDLKQALAWVVCVTLWIVMILMWRA
jgi:hypothetical protein